MESSIISIPEFNISSSDRTVNTTRSTIVSAAEDYAEMVIRLTVIIILFISMVSLGCTMEVSKIKNHLFKPKGVAIAVGAQFGIMPLTAFCLAKLFQLSPIENLTVLICGCCPGGQLSNILALALHGDMNLSIVMTVCSTVLALGMMPLLLHLYSMGFLNLAHLVPYSRILFSLIMLLVPYGLGILINHKVPQYSKIIHKVALTILVISCIVIGVFAGFSDRGQMFTMLSPRLVAIAGLMPLTGFICGYILSTIFRMNEAYVCFVKSPYLAFLRFSGIFVVMTWLCVLSSSCRRTISMEVGCQNIQLCTTILTMGFSSKIIGLLYLFPSIYFLFQIIEALFIIFLFRCYQILHVKGMSFTAL
ncbi:hypothetical protein DNTS_023891 [Danionella cerebrum]|uniref:Solute carrier family 10 member 1 n=1 Tax=Danionella cerebrum TaxID=2873325 RepID=A0A553MUT8_9TELE|nr:hypothetical protein DNTS_023891 [Danionella translucida]